jgi:general secretion pathway protein A
MTADHREALAGLIYSSCTRPGLTVLVGEAGTGKTTLLYSLVNMIEKRRFITALCTNPTLTREEFYDLLLLKLGIRCPSSLKSRQLVALQENLLKNRADGRPSVLIVDEAQRLSPELLEEIRLLLNLETPREKLLEIIIAGQPELWEVLRRPDLRQLKQRISYICRLQPLTSQETREYIEHRLARAGLVQQQLFSEAVIDVIFEYSHGIPRLINTLCDTALRNGFADQASRITIPIVRESAKELDLERGFLESALIEEEALLTMAASENSRSRGSNDLNHSNRIGNNDRVPLESYASRQKSQSFFSSVMERWK